MKIKHALYFFIGSLFLSNCNNAFVLKDGKTAYELKRYSKATEMLQTDFEKAKDNTARKEIATQIADAYSQFSDFANAEKWYKKATELDNVDAYFKLGKIQMMQEKYADAIKVFTIFGKQDATSKYRASKEIKNCENALLAKSESSNYAIKNITQLNTSNRDYAPFVLKDKIYFSSTRNLATGDAKNEWTNEKSSDIFIAKNNLATIENLGEPVNTSYSEGSSTLSKDGKDLYFTRCGVVDDKADNRKNEYCNVFFSKYNGTSFDEPIALKLFDDSTNVGQPTISNDGKTLIVTASTRGGIGGKDLYYFTKNDTGWTGPYNLGANINTPGDEMYPWLDAKNQLYYSSNGMSGYGGYDIYKAQRSKTGWKNPQNLGYGINSGADDFGFFMTKYKPTNTEDTVLSAGYFSSNRLGGKGEDDIYFFEEKWKNTFLLVGNTRENEYEDTANADSKIIGLKSLDNVKLELKNATTDATITSFKSNASGYFTQSLDPETDYKLVANKTGYFSSTVLFTTKGKKNQDSTQIHVFTQLILAKIFPQKEIEIPNIYYDYDKANLRPESKAVLDSIMIFFSENKNLIIEIGSHTDSRGNDDYNEKLSQARAQSVVDYLVEKGMAPDRLVAKGYGETRLVNKCGNDVPCTEEEHQRNRRTTFRITGSNEKIESVEPENIEVDPK